MEGAPRGIDLQVVARTLDKLPHLVGAHDFHAWTLTSDKHVFSAHLRIDAPQNAAPVLREAHELLRQRFGFSFSTLQVETECLDEDHARDLDIWTLLRLPKQTVR